jgi:large subunit ribosomal protein L10
VLTRAQKEEQVERLKEKFSRATGVFVVDYCGISVDQANGLRGDLRGDAPEESEYQVTKNTLLRLAVVDSGLEAITDQFTGTTAIAISYADPVRVAKVMVKAAKEIEPFEVRGGYMDGQALSESDVATLATLPSLLELRATLAGLIQAPATKLVRLLNEPGSQLARLVDARRSSLEEGGS